jgi:DNA-directed RNA polymerase subunit RPC12/RpoP
MLCWRADLPAFIHHHDAEPPLIVCPSCARLPMYIKEVAPIWSMAKLDLTYECSNCGAQIRQTVTEPELLNSARFS